MDTPPETDEHAYPLFQVPTDKFMALSICSFGVYTIFWTYQMWKRIADHEHEDISPFWRTFFAPIWNFWLFGDIRRLAAVEGIDAGWNPAALASLYILVTLMLRLPEPLSLLGFTSVLAYLPVQQTAADLNDRFAATVTEPRNDRYGAAGIATVVIGGLLLLLVIVGTLLPH
jgi:hypothetical protein